MEKTLLVEEFAYELPQALIAQEPAQVRDESRLLRLGRRDQAISHYKFRDIVELLQPGDLLVVNDTKVIPARFFASRKSGGILQILLIKPEASKPGQWEAMASRVRRLDLGEVLTTTGTEKKYEVRVVDIISGANAQRRLVVDLGSHQNTFDLLKEIGFAPLPPYIRRDQPTPPCDESVNLEDGDCVEDDPLAIEARRISDIERYQTVFAVNPGAVAAPTAGLHFSQDTLDALQERGVEIHKITLHVGPGTFKPITDSIEEHQIEAENFWISEETARAINEAKAESRRIIAVGTTTCRALESSFQNGSLQAAFNQSTSLYIKPGFNFQVIDGLVTNFHLSKSSLLVLVAAFAGRAEIMNAYQIAIEAEYRFYSYGDAMLII
jgi:S-adenosylmethionine:tRNA ribosyltransferase-isomerase